MATVHTNVTDEDGDLTRLSQFMLTFARGVIPEFDFDTGDGLTVRGHTDHGFRTVEFTDTNGACDHAV